MATLVKIKGFPSKPREVMPPPNIEHVSLGGKIDHGIEEKQRQSQGRDQGEYNRRLFALKLICFVSIHLVVKWALTYINKYKIG